MIVERDITSDYMCFVVLERSSLKDTALHTTQTHSKVVIKDPSGVVSLT